jgi:hypothetical protein
MLFCSARDPSKKCPKASGLFCIAKNMFFSDILIAKIGVKVTLKLDSV